jgi:hypothetical protein
MFSCRSVVYEDSSDPPPGTLDAIRSAARMGDARALLALTEGLKDHPILDSREGDFMGCSALHWAVAAGSPLICDNIR